MSRESILSAVLNNQPTSTAMPKDLSFESIEQVMVVAKFIELIDLIGGTVIRISDLSDITSYISTHYNSDKEIISQVSTVSPFFSYTGLEDPHRFQNTEFALFEAHFGVAENGAIWLTEERMGHRILPFICQHLGVIVRENSILANMHDAYQIIDSQEYGFGTFIAGPSKTADIEQSLVLGAHGARSMTIFLL